MLLSAEVGGGLEFGGVEGAVGEGGAEAIEDGVAGGAFKGGGAEADVIVEEAAELVLRVGDGVEGEQEEARGLDGAGGDDDAIGGEGGGAAAVVEDADGADGADGDGGAGEELGGVGVRVEGDGGVGEEIAAEGVGEVAARERGPF